MEAQLVLGALVGACRATPSAKASNGTTVDLTAACTALTGYDKTGNLGAAGGWLFSEWAAYAPSNGLWSDSFNPAQPLTTPSVLDTANPAVLQALADAVVNLQQRHIPLDATYRQVQHVVRNGTSIPIPGCDTGCFNAIYAADGQGGPLTAFPYGVVYEGSSLVMTTELTPSGPISQGILTYSQATDPTSPGYATMTKLYSEKRWVPLAYTPAQLAAEHGTSTQVVYAP
jgi:acyl-homoserine-lactone acylase